MGFGTLGLQNLVIGGSAPWALAPDAGIDIDFINDRGFNSAVSNSAIGTSTSFLTTARAAPSAYSWDSVNLYSAFATNIPRRTNRGLLMEATKTNVVLWNRDMTNAAWTKTSVTAALDQTGIDGTVTSASSLLATGANGTCLQAITLASSARWQSAFVKRITGTGVINMTMDNGSTWTPITVTSTTTWSRVQIATQTITDPTVGFQIVTNGDKIAVDFVQNENAADFASSPILTTTVAVTRATDNITITTPPTFGSAVSAVVQFTPTASAVSTSDPAFLSMYADLNNNVLIWKDHTTAHIKGICTLGGVNVIPDSAILVVQGTSVKAAIMVANSDQAIVATGGSVVAGGSPNAWPPSPNISLIRLGGNATSASGGNAFIERVTIWPVSRITNARALAYVT